MRKNFPTFFHCLVGWYHPKCLKGCSLGILATKKRGLVLFWGTSKICKIGESKLKGERTYRGENV